jgi:co-chaperonin GroES (HSP10)
MNILRNLRLVGRKALIYVPIVSDILQSGLLLPRVARERPQVGTVVAIGQRRPGDPDVGSVVMYPKFTDPTARGIQIGSQFLLYLEIDELLVEFYDLSLDDME